MTSSLLSARRGSQTPRVANYPPYRLSAAPEVIGLAASAGLHLDEWQQYVLTHGLGMHEDGRWTANKVSCWVPRQNGKGGIIEALELAWLFLFGEAEIVHSAHEHRTSAKAYRRMEGLIRRTPDLHRLVRPYGDRPDKAGYRKTNGEQQIELHDGRLLQYNTRSGTAARGFSSPKIVLDEAQELDGDQMAAILPTVSAMPNWQAWFFGTPPRNPDAWCYGLREDGEAGIPRLAHFDWGADLDPTKPAGQERARDRNLWYACNPALGIRILEDTVEDECKPSGLGDKFPIERLGAWLPRQHGGGLFDHAQWDRLIDLESRRDGDVALALDITPMRDHASIGLYGMRSDGLEHVQLVDYRPGVDWIVARAAELTKVLDPICWVIDAKNGAAALAPALAEVGITVPEDPEQPLRGQLLVLGVNEVAAAVGQYVDVVRAERIRHLGEEPLNAAIRNVRPRQIGDAGQIAYGRKASEVDIGPAQVVTEARYGWHAWRDLVTADYDVLDSVF
ncbi:MAG TPA: hypothetical protein VFR67_05885 [Pilimelia sp.]|nr:hypothetical protein [Pilimelia sp.]